MNKKMFESSREAETWFLHKLSEKRFKVNEVVAVKIRSGRGRVIKQKRAICDSGDLFQIAFWTKLYQLVKTEDLREDYAKERDLRIKSVLNLFGFGDLNVLGLQMEAVLELLETIEKGFTPHLIFLIKDGRCLWCTAIEFYNFIIRYESFLLYSHTYGGEFCLVPVNWLKSWNADPLSAAPSIVNK